MATASPPHLPEGARVLVIRLSALGDVLFALETVAALAAERPDVTVDFLTDDRYAGFLSGHPTIDRVLAFPRTRPMRAPFFLMGTLRRTRWDAVLDLHGIAKSALNVLFARSPLKMGCAPPASREGAHRVYHRAVPVPSPLPHRADRGLLLLRDLGLTGERRAPDLPEPEVTPHFWPDDGRRRVVLHPGTSSFAAFKRWPAERFAELAGELCADACVAISFGPGEEALARALHRAVPATLLLDGRRLGLPGLAAVYARADVLVAADTGPLHLAAARGTPVVALFGPKDPALYGPRGAHHEVLYRDVPCRPCRRRDCAAPLCIRGVPVAPVARAVHRVLTP